MVEMLGGTQSLCSVCGGRVAARIEARDGEVWFHKVCPEHGREDARVCGSIEYWQGLGRYHRAASVPMEFATEFNGCPDSCGLCPEHEQHVCMPILEITDHCDMDCPICLVDNRHGTHWTRAELALVLDRLIAAEGQIDVLNLSGGEPTLHPEFREMIDDCLARPEVLRVSVSTNGLSLMADPSLFEFLALRRVVVSLQCDGFDDDADLVLRGRPLAGHRRNVIERGAELGAPMSLTATVVAGVSDGALPALAEALFAHEHVLSLMLQPAAYAGHAAALGRPRDATTIPDAIAALEGAGSVSAKDFSPLPCSHPACFALAFYLRAEDGRWISLAPLIDTDRYLDLISNRTLPGTDEDSFRAMMEAVYDLWSGPAALLPDGQRALGAARRLLAGIGREGYCPACALRAAEGSIKSIFIHQFMDRASFDLARARKCCQVYPQPDGRMIPACVHNCLGRNRWAAAHG